MNRFITVAISTLLATSAFGADSSLVWPRFRGPGGSGVANDQKPPVEIGVDKNVKWKVPVPGGLSSPIVAGDNLILTAFDDGKLYTFAYRRADGKEVWRAQALAREIEPYNKAEGSPAASTPATDGERIVSYFGSCGLVCYDFAGKELWKFEMPPAHLPGAFGSGVSPIVADGVVVIVRDQTKGSSIVALDAATGLPKWEKKRQSPASYCTPVVWDTPAGKQVVAAGHARMVGYDLGTGAERWSLFGMPTACCSSPVIADGTLFFAGWSGGPEDKENQMPSYDGLIKDHDTNKDGVLSRTETEEAFKEFFDSHDGNKDGKITRDEWDAILKFMSEGKSSAFALKAGGSGDITESHVLWKHTKSLPYVASAIVYHGQLVTVKDGGIVTAYDAKTGVEVYMGRAAAGGKYYASPVAANGHIYFTSLDGAVTVLQAGSKKPVVVARNEKLGERTAATPAIADDTLYVRTEKHLYAFAAANMGADAKDSNAINGTWLPSSAEFAGQKFSDEIRKTIKLVIKGDTYTATVGKNIDKGTWKLDPTAKPKTLDIGGTDGPNKGKRIQAIYEVDGDTLRVCYDLSGNSRPTEFKTTAGTQLFLVTYERERR